MTPATHIWNTAILLVLLGVPFFASAQTATPNQIPGLEQRLALAEAASEKAALCNELSAAWQKKDIAQAVRYAEQANAFARAADDKREWMKSLHLLGDVAVRQNNPSKASEWYQEALELALATNDAEMEGRALHNTGKLAQTLGKQEDALAYYEKAYHIRERIGDKQGLSATTQNLGVLFSARSDYEKSNFYYKKAVQLKEEIGDLAGVATVQANLANNCFFLGRFSEAELLLRACINTQTALGNKRGMAQAYQTLGSVCSRTGQNDAAIDAFLKAKTLYQELGDVGNTAGALNNLGHFYIDRAAYVPAQETLLEALRVAESVHEGGELMYLIHLGLGRIKGYQSLFEEELAWYAKALPYARNDLGRAGLLAVMSAAYIGDLQFEKGLTVALEGAELARKNGFHDKEADCLSQAASALLNLKRTDEAVQTIDQAIAQAKKINYQALLPAAMVVRSRIAAQKERDNQVVLAHAREALKTAQKIDSPLEVAHALEELAEAYRRLERTDLALEALKKAQQLRDSIYSREKVRDLAVQEKDYEFAKERAAIELEQTRAAAAAADALRLQRQQRNNWILALSALLLGSSGYFLFWRNRQRNRVRLQEAETRQRIARDLHDEMGSTLSSISILSEAALRNMPAGADHTPYMTIGERARQVMEAMSDIVWSVNPHNDTMANVVQRMKAFSIDVLEAQGIALHFKADESIGNLNLPMEQRKDFYLLFKEALNNAAKYSNAGDVWVNVQTRDGGLVLEVRDNGRGFDPAAVKQGNGLRNIEQRAERMGGTVRLESVSNVGTTLVFDLQKHAIKS